ncbi:BURP domain-containing protein, partial [Dioscorea alata]
ANTIPFSSNNLSKILTHFQVKPRSVTAGAMKKTLASSITVNKQNGDDKMKLSYSKLVACHSWPYPYVVFYYYATGKSKAYTVALEENDETKVEAIALCHLDTSKSNLKHLSFQVLKVKPTGVPICHFMLEDHVLWTVRK